MEKDFSGLKEILEFYIGRVKKHPNNLRCFEDLLDVMKLCREEGYRWNESKV